VLAPVLLREVREMRRAALACLAVIAAMPMACGGTVIGGGGDNGGGSGGGGGSSGGGGGGEKVPPNCPKSAPPEASACPSVGFQCQYGSNVFDCVQVAECTASGWTLKDPGGDCTSSVCASSYDDLAHLTTKESKCASSLAGTTCWYPQGTCSCIESLGGPATTGGPWWTCEPVESGCPYPAPPLGGECGEPGLFCTYGNSCQVDNNFQCEHGVWKHPNVGCPT
jgi:hypothetical protein